MLLIPSLGMMFHHTVMRFHEEDLSMQKEYYAEIFETQQKKGLIIDLIIEKLHDLRITEGRNLTAHGNTQSQIISYLRQMEETRPSIPDSAYKMLEDIPPIYDSLYAEIKLIQFTRDSVRILEDQNKNLKFQLKESLDAQKKKVKAKPAQNF